MRCPATYPSSISSLSTSTQSTSTLLALRLVCLLPFSPIWTVDESDFDVLRVSLILQYVFIQYSLAQRLASCRPIMITNSACLIPSVSLVSSVMSGLGSAYHTPRCSGSSSSGGKKRSSGELDGLVSSGKRSRSSMEVSAPRQLCASPPSPVAMLPRRPSSRLCLGRMQPWTDSLPSFLALLTDWTKFLRNLWSRRLLVPLSSSEEEEGQIQASQPDPLDDLDQLAPDETVDEDFTKVL